MKRRHLITGFVALACAMLVSRADASVTGASSAALDASRFSATVDHPLVPLSSVRFKVFKGRERDPRTGESVAIRSEVRVLGKTTRVAGVRVAVMDVKEFEDGALVEHTLDYFAQRDDGSVWYFGERVDDYEDGKLVGHDGQWLAGRNGEAGAVHAGRRSRRPDLRAGTGPGVAEDRSTVVAMGRTVKTPAGTFRNCIKTRDVAPLDKKTESKFYCRGVGLVREQSTTVLSELARYTKR